MFKDNSINIAYQMGAYKAIAELMRDRIRDLGAAEDEFNRDWAARNLMQLADQFDDAVKKFDHK